MPEIKSETPKVINLSGSLIVDRAATLKEELSAALEESSQILLSLSLVEEIDLACLQVLYSTKKSAAAAGKQIHFIGTVSSRIARRLAATGFLRGTPERAEDFEAQLTGF
jgi:anti-anti-sigma factor